jgi:hypothetical protein
MPLVLCVFTGVDDVVPGSVIAVAYIDFTEGTPDEVVDAAVEQLHTTGQNMYADSKLPSNWGWLLNYSTGVNKTALMEDTAGDVQIQSMAFPSNAAQTRTKHNRISVTATVAVVVAVAAVICAVVCVVILMKRRSSKERSTSNHDPKMKGARESGGGGASEYLRDLDGMDDGASERTKFSSFARVSTCFSATQHPWIAAQIISTSSGAVLAATAGSSSHMAVQSVPRLPCCCTDTVTCHSVAWAVQFRPISV